VKLNNNSVTKVTIKIVIKHTHNVSHPSNAQRIAERESSVWSFSLTCIPHMQEWISAISRVRRARPRRVGGASTLKMDSTPVDDEAFCAIDH
jgi:hypothetical protein